MKADPSPHSYLFTSATIPIPVHSAPKCSTRTYPVCDASLSRPARSSFAPLQKSRQNQPFLCINRSPVRYGFRAGAIAVRYSGSPIGFFYPVIPTQNFGQSRNPKGYFWHPTSRAYFQSPISPRSRFKIPNPEPQIREIPHPEKLIGDPRYSVNIRHTAGAPNENIVQNHLNIALLNDFSI